MKRMTTLLGAGTWRKGEVAASEGAAFGQEHGTPCVIIVIMVVGVVMVLVTIMVVGVVAVIISQCAIGAAFISCRPEGPKAGQ